MEQPVAADDLPGLKYVKNHTDIPVIADESVVTPADAIRIVSGDCADGINVKIMKSGIQGALDIVAIAKAAGLKLMIGCMLESNPGFCASICLAAGTGLFDFIDLDAHILIAGNTAYTGYGAKNGLIAPYQQYPGWGITT
jgi:L-alanine-DL-glutamate epimerase-like enolase superfamily enzyme